MNTQQLQDALMELIDWETQDVAAAVEWAEEQLAEMRELLELAQKAFAVCEGEYCPDADHRISQYLSAVPKRGRVVWEGTGTLLHKTFQHDDGPFGNQQTRIHEYASDNPISLELSGHVGQHGKLHTVTVREAE